MHFRITCILLLQTAVFFNVVYETLLLHVLTWCTFFWNQQWELSLVPLSVISYLVAQSVKVFRLWSVGLRFIFHTCPVLLFVLFDISNKFNFGENVVENEIFEKSMFPISVQFYLYKYCKVSHSTWKMFQQKMVGWRKCLLAVYIMIW